MTDAKAHSRVSVAGGFFLGARILSSPVAPGTAGAQASWADIFTLIEDLGGIIIEGDLTEAKPVDTIVRSIADGQLWVSTNAAIATYIQLTNTGATGIAGLVTVAIAGGDFSTITEGIAAANSGDVVLVYPGTYPENITIPGGVVVVGAVVAQVPVVIAGADTTGTRVTLTGGAAPPGLRSITVVGPSAGANPAIDASGLGGGAGAGGIFDVLLQGGGGTATGAGILGAGTGMLIVRGLLSLDPTAFGGPLIDLTSGALIWANSVLINGGGSDILRTAGSAMAQVNDVIVGPGWVSTDGFEVGGTARLEGVAIQIDESAAVTNALHVVSDGVSIELEAVDLVGSTFDILVDPALAGTGTSFEYSGLLVESRLSAPATYFDTATSLLNTGDTTQGKQTLRADMLITKKLDVGQPSVPGGLDVGEGGSYQIASDGTPIRVFTYDASAASGSRFTEVVSIVGNEALALTLLSDIGDRLYVGCADPYWAPRVVVSTAGSAEGWAGKYWNGAALADVDFMAVEKENAARLGEAFMEATDTEYATFDRDLTTLWAAADDQLDEVPSTGVALFWTCFQAVATHATAPVLEEIKIRGSDVDFVSGVVHQVYWGTARAVIQDTIPAANLKKQGAGAPTLVDVPVAVGIVTEGQRFSQNDTLPLSWVVPKECDTSCEVRIGVTYTSSATSTITLALAHRTVTSGAAISSGTAVDGTITRTITPTGTDVMDEDTKLTAALDRLSLQTASPGERIYFDIKRTDGNAGTFDLVDLTIEYVSWQRGGVS